MKEPFPIQGGTDGTAGPPDRSPFLYSVLLSLVVLAVYLNATAGGFVFDDWPLIARNWRVHYLSQWKEILIGYRPVRTLVLAVVYHFFGDNPTAYHVVNILIHALTVSIVYRLVDVLAKNTKVAFLSALIFAIHPIQTDSVAYISGIRDTLCGLFYVTSFYWFVRYRESQKKPSLIALLVFYILGVLTKEPAATLVMAYFAYDFVQELSPDRPASIRETMGVLIRQGLRILNRYRWFYAGMGAIFLWAVWYYVVLRRSSAHISETGISWHGGSQYLNYVSIPKIIVYYIKQLLYPIHLMADYKHFPILAKSATEPKVLLAAAAVGGLIVAAFRMSFNRKLAAFAIFWFFITLSPGLNILPHHEFMAEHYLYLPSMGFAMLIGLGTMAGIARAPTRATRVLWTGLAVLLLFFYAGRTVIRNLDWQNDLRLSQAQLKIRPDSPRTLAEMSYLYLEMNLLESAQAAAEKALSINPGHLGARNNLGVIYSQLGESEKALEEFKEASKSKKRLTINTYANMGISYMILEDEEKGIQSFEKGLEHDPSDSLSLISLAHIYMDRGNYAKAAEYLRQNLEYRGDDIAAYYLLAEIYEKVLQFEAAGKIYEIILDLKPEESEAVRKMTKARSAQHALQSIEFTSRESPASRTGAIQLAELYLLFGEFRKARVVIESAMESFGRSAEFWMRLSEIQFLLEDFPRAEESALLALASVPHDVTANLILAKLRALNLDFSGAEEPLRWAEREDPDSLEVQQVARTIRVNAQRHARTQWLRESGASTGELDYLLGQIYMSMGLYLDAVERWSEVPAGSPFSLQAKRDLAELYLGKKGFRWTLEGIKVLRKMLEEDPDNLWALNRLAFVFFTDIKDYERALTYFSDSLERYPDQEQADRLMRIKTGLGLFRHAVLVENRYMLPYMEELGRLDSGEAPRERRESLE